MREKQRKNTHVLLSLLLSAAMVLGNFMPLLPKDVQMVEASGGEIHVYESTPGDVASTKYTLTANGTAVPVVKYSANGNNFDIARFSSADATPEYSVQVEETIHQVTVYPERYYPKENIQISEDKHSVTFTMSDQLRYAFVMINGGPTDQAGKPYLAIINDPPETDKPDISAANVLNAKEFMENYLQEHPNSGAQEAEPAGTTSGGTAYEAGELVENTATQVRFPNKRRMTEDDVTYALQAALDEIYREGSAYDTLYFPAGVYVCSGLEIRGRKGKPVTIYMEEGALMKNRLQECMQAMEPAIGIWDSQNITISGRGIFDGNGVENYRKDRHDAKDSCHQGGVMIVRSSNIVFNDTYVRDAKQWNWESHGSKNCTLNNIKGLTPYNQPWVDGLDMASAQDLTINGALTLGNDDNFASGHYNPSDGFLNTVPGFDQYNSDCLAWDTEDSFNVSVSNTLGWSFSGGNGIRLGHDSYSHTMRNYTFENVNTMNFTGGGNGITVQNGTGNNRPYPKYEELTFRNCSFDTTRVGTNFNINGLDADNQIAAVTLENCWFSNGEAGSYVNQVTNLTIKNHYVGGQRVTVSSQAKLTTTGVGTIDHDWTENQAPVFTLPSDSELTAKTGEELSLRVNATDGDGETPVLAVKEGTLPEGAVFDAASGNFNWTPQESQVGKHVIVFTATDAHETTEKSIEIQVKSSKYKAVSVTAIEDATVKSWKTEKTKNYGGLDYIRTMRMGDALSDDSSVGIFGEAAGNDANDDRDSKISFLSFDAAKLRTMQNTMNKAELVLTYIGRRESSKTGEDRLMAVRVSDEWKETELKWSNLPTLDTTSVKTSESFPIDKNNVVMAQDEKYNTSQGIDGTKVTIDVTEWVQNLDPTAKTLSLAVCEEKGIELAFVSREGVSNMTNAAADMAPSLQLYVEKDADEPEVTYDCFTPNSQWLDNQGVMIQAHGGGVLWDQKTQKYYWYGEHKGENKLSDGNIAAIGVSCYSSTDLYNWKNEGMALPVFNNPAFLTKGEASNDTPLYLAESSEEYQQAKADGKKVSEYDTLEKYNTKEAIASFNALYADMTAEKKQELYDKLNWNCVMERPKVIYNAKNDNYVMWFHKDGEGVGKYELAQTGIAVSDSPTGPFKLLDTIRPNGNESRDMTLFVDEDGTGYLLYSSEDNWTLYLAELNEDYTGLTGKYSRNYVDKSGSKGVYAREAPAIFKDQGSYYLISSGCTGWRPNAMGYSVTKNIQLGLSEQGENGPFQMDNLKNPCIGPEADISFGGQSTYVLPVQGKKGSFVYMGDKWNANNLKDSRYQWLPIQVDSENQDLMISWSDSWKLDDFTNLNSAERTALNQAVRQAQGLSAKEYDFGQQRWSKLQQLLEEALALPYETQTGVLAEKKEELTLAIQELKRWRALDAALAQVEDSAPAMYTAESWKAVQNAYDSAKLLKADAKEAEIQAAADAITEAIGKLKTIEIEEVKELGLSGKMILADSQHAGNEASKAIDGDQNTFWHCDWGNSASPLPHALTIDLGEAYEDLYQLSYLPRQDKDSNGIATKYRIMVSNAAKELSELKESDFQEVRTGTWAEDKEEKTTIFRTENAVRFVKFEVIAGVGDLASAAEIRLFRGTPKKDPNPITPPEEKPDPTPPEEKPDPVPPTEENPTPTPPGGNQQPNKVKVKKVSVSAPAVKIAAGKKVKLKVSVTPKKAANRAVKWSTSKKKYATVNSKGVVTTKKAGKGKIVTITATAKDGSKKKGSIRIKIMKHAVTKVSFKKPPKTLKAGKKVTLKAVVKTNGKSANKTLKWSTSNKKYATVTSKGKVTAKKAGKGKRVTITAVSTDGTNKKASVKIKIKK
ncbi:MAG: family 43 glycosylhydrolase [Lachnospiraceae bacterium]|nr:family 43 glycosylhydrolase [Lachnospiraceae bacterium]